MKRFLVFVFVIAILAVGAAWAQDQQTTTVDQPAVTVTTDQPSTTADSTADQTQTGDQTAKPEEENKPIKPKTNYGLMIGMFNPTDAKVKDIFGSSWVRYGIRPLPKDLPEKWRPVFDISYYAMARDENKVTLIPITGGILKGLGNDKNIKSYVAVNMGPFYGNVDAPKVGVEKKGFGLNTNATYGMIIKDRLSIEARYEWMSDFGGLDFSAFTISAAFKIFSARG